MAPKRQRYCAPPGQRLDPSLVRCAGCFGLFSRNAIATHRAASPRCRQVAQVSLAPIGASQSALPHQPAELAADEASAGPSEPATEAPDPDLSRNVSLSGLASAILRERRLHMRPELAFEAAAPEAPSEVVAAVAETCAQLHRSLCDRLLRATATQLGLPWKSAHDFHEAMLDDGQVDPVPAGPWSVLC